MRIFRHLGVRLFLLLVALNVGAFAVACGSTVWVVAPRRRGGRSSTAC